MTQPSRRDRMRPAELVGFAAVLAVFVGLVVLLSTRDFSLAVVFLGVVFIVVLVVVAMLGLSVKTPPPPRDHHDDQPPSH